MSLSLLAESINMILNYILDILFLAVYYENLMKTISFLKFKKLFLGVDFFNLFF